MCRPTFRLLDNCNIIKFIQSNRNQSPKLHRLVTELVGPLESFLNEKKTSNEMKTQLVEELHSAVEVGGAEAKEGDQTLDEVFAQNENIAGIGSRKRHRSCQEEQFLSNAATTNDEAMYNSGNGNEATTVERGRKALKMNEHDCSSQQVGSLRKRRKRPASSREIIELEATVNSSGKKIPESHYPSEQLLTGISHTKNPGISQLLKDTSPAFQKRIEELRAFKAKFGHCNVSTSRSVSNKPYLSLGTWCCDIRRSRRMIENGKKGKHKLCENRIECLDDVGFQWDTDNVTFDDRIKELRVFKAKFGHCNVSTSKSASNKPYVSLGNWCGNIRQSRRLMENGMKGNNELCENRIKCLDEVGFKWNTDTVPTFDERIEELRAFKAKFGHCNVSTSRSASNKPYFSFATWCCHIRHSRRMMENGKEGSHKLCEDRIKCLDDVGFQWDTDTVSFDDRIKELRAFKTKFGHCNVSKSKSASNKPYSSLETWCYDIRRSRRLMENGKRGKIKLCKDRIGRLDALGFQWKV